MAAARVCPAQPNSCNCKWEFPSIRCTFFGVLKIRILLFRWYYIRVPYVLETPKCLQANPGELKTC